MFPRFAWCAVAVNAVLQGDGWLRHEEHGGAVMRAEKPHAIFSDGERPFGI